MKTFVGVTIFVAAVAVPLFVVRLLSSAFVVDAVTDTFAVLIRHAPWMLPTALGVTMLLPKLAVAVPPWRAAVRCAVLSVPVGLAVAITDLFRTSIEGVDYRYTFTFNGVVEEGPSLLTRALFGGLLVGLYFLPLLAIAGFLLAAQSRRRSEA